MQAIVRGNFLAAPLAVRSFRFSDLPAERFCLNETRSQKQSKALKAGNLPRFLDSLRA